MKIIDKVMECFAELGEGCESAYDQTVDLMIMLQTASKGKLALMATMLVLSSIIMTILIGLTASVAGLFGPVLLWVAFSLYGHSSPFFFVRMGFILWWMLMQIITGLAVIAIATLLLSI